MRICVNVPGTPKAQPRPRAFKNAKGDVRVYDAATAEGWKSQVAAAFHGLLPKEPLCGPLQVSITFRLPRPKGHYRTGKHSGELRDDAPAYHAGKPDRDNLEKAVLDALTQAGLWRDDGQVCRGEVVKVWANGRPGADIVVQTLE